MPSPLERKSSLAVFFLAFTLALPLCAQYRGAPKKTNPRAVAVVQVLPNGKAKLLPVSIFLNGQFYDARYYMAKPVPLSLYSDTVYEALTDGLPTAEFVVHGARLQPNVIWGEGDWKPLGASSKPKSGKSSGSDDSHGVSTVTFPGTVKETKEERRQDKRDAKDKKKQKPEPRPASTTPPPTNPPKDDNDPDRPTLKKTQTEAQVKLKPEDVTPKMPSDDTDRPVLTRANKEQVKPEPITAPQIGVPGAKYMVAISDPDPMENRPYHYNWTEPEKAKYTAKMTQLALDAAKKFASNGSGKSPLPTGAKFTDVEVRALDLDYSNSPYLVFSGRMDPAPAAPPTGKTGVTSAPEQAPEIYATLVVRVGSNGEMNPLMTKVTDAKHLDSASRYDLIDAVDADGDNRAELLFRRTNDSGSTYVLFRVTPFQLTQVFEGGAAI